MEGNDSSKYFTDHSSKEAKYLHQNGLRIVQPFYTTLETFSKGRWIGKQLIEVLCSEFTGYSREYYVKKINNGDIKINNKQTQQEYLLKHKDKLQHRLHKHEPPVTSAPISIVYSDAKIVVIDKPSSIPVHPTGRYHHNSILCILATENNMHELCCVHRLDRLTSGILILAKTKEAAKELSDMFASGKIHKKYIAKVDGQFSSEEVKVEKSIQENKPRKGKNYILEEGNPCVTLFKRLSYDAASNTSEPDQGKNHQIRVHLSSIGFPISNDPLYGNGKRAKLGEALKKELEEFDIDCPECLNPHLDPTEEQMCIYLHAFCYKSGSWEFKAPFPDWASNDTNKL